MIFEIGLVYESKILKILLKASYNVSFNFDIECLH